MADLYVLAVDLPSHEDPVKNAFRYQAGDVIMVREDGDGPGKWAETANVYKVVRVPGAAQKWEYLTAERPFDFSVTQPCKIKRFNIADVYAVQGMKGAPHEVMGTCIALTSAEASIMMVVTKADAGGLVI
jgi:hypothetical protein